MDYGVESIGVGSEPSDVMRDQYQNIYSPLNTQTLDHPLGSGVVGKNMTQAMFPDLANNGDYDAYGNVKSARDMVTEMQPAGGWQSQADYMKAVEGALKREALARGQNLEDPATKQIYMEQYQKAAAEAPMRVVPTSKDSVKEVKLEDGSVILYDMNRRRVIEQFSPKPIGSASQPPPLTPQTGAPAVAGKPAVEKEKTTSELLADATKEVKRWGDMIKAGNGDPRVANAYSVASKELNELQQRQAAELAATKEKRQQDQAAANTAVRQKRLEASISTGTFASKNAALKSGIGAFEEIVNNFNQPAIRDYAGPITGNVGKALSTVSGGVINPEMRAYEKVKRGFIATLKSMTGDVGVMTDVDANRLEGLMPEIGDSPKVADLKVSLVRRILAQAEARSSGILSNAMSIVKGGATDESELPPMKVIENLTDNISIPGADGKETVVPFSAVQRMIEEGKTVSKQAVDKSTVQMTAPDGKMWNIKADKVAEAKKRGFK